jgi:ABC-type dipeptide/oligopeptide/nickel transport system permease component
MFFRYVGRRLFVSIPVMLAVVFITYGLAIYGAGDPVATIVGQTEQRGNEELIARLRHQHGYDRPFVVQYVRYVEQFITGNWGTSFQMQDQSVRVLIFRTLPVSFQLGLVAIVLLIGIGVPLGIAAAVRQDSWLDRLIVSLSVLFHSVPAFVLAPVLLVVFVLKVPIIRSAVGWDGIFSQKVILPAFVLALGPMLLIVRQTRYSVSEVLQEDYIRTARAKGLNNPAIIWGHVLRNAMPPILTLSGIIAAYLVTGSIFVEEIFGIPGFGQLIVTALRHNDLPVLMGTTIVSAVIILASNLLIDLLYAVIDPRVKYD